MMHYKAILDRIAEAYAQALGDNLVGIYVHGSIAFGCYNPHKSDIDLIVVVRTPLTVEMKRAVMEATIEAHRDGPPKGIEMSVVLKKHCQDFVYPTPYDLHFSNMHIELYESDPAAYFEQLHGVDKDLAAHFTVIRHKGMVLRGAAIDTVFGPVSKEFYMDSVWYDIKDARENVLGDPAYVVLNLCRTMAYVRDGVILSKRGGGQWGMTHLPPAYHGLIAAALDSYASDRGMKFDDELAVMFCEEMLEKLKVAFVVNE